MERSARRPIDASRRDTDVAVHPDEPLLRVTNKMPEPPCKPVSRERFTVSDSERMEGSTALDDSGTARRDDSGDRLERAVSKADWPRNGQAASGQLSLPGVTPDLFLEAGAAIKKRAMALGVAGDQIEAMGALAVAQGAAARGRPWCAT